MMAYDWEQENKLKQYFLGELTFEEQVLVEERMFLDSDYAELAQTVEDDLIHDYLHKDLTVEETLRFEGRFIKRPERKVDLRIAEALIRYIDPSFVAAHAAYFLERHSMRIEARPGGAAHTDLTSADIEQELFEESPSTPKSPSIPKSPKQTIKWWLLLAAAILILLLIGLWFASDFIR